MENPGFFGKFGGRFVAETLMAALDELTFEYNNYGSSKEFWKEYLDWANTYVPRPSPLYHAKRLGNHLGLNNLYLKREDLNHTGAHKVNNCLGQILLAKHMGKKRIIAETGAGQHGVATATVCAYFGLPCRIYMGSLDVKRQHLNVVRMKLLGAEVFPVESGTKTLKDALNEAIKDWVSNVDDTYYLIGSATGPHPYPLIVRDLQSIIGKEIKVQSPKIPDWIFACVGGGSNAIGAFHAFIEDQTKLVGVEAGGNGEKHAATLGLGSPGVLHGAFSYLLQDKKGQIMHTHSISAGLDYPGVGPEHAKLKESGRAQYISATDQEALEATKVLCLKEGIIPALESAHALAGLTKMKDQIKKDELVVINLSGRGDKDMGTLAEVFNF